MTIIVRDDFTVAGSLDPSKWVDAVTNFYKGQTASHWMQADGAFCACGLDLTLYDPDVDMLFHGKGEAVTFLGASVANQYFEMGIETRTNTFSAGHNPVFDNPGQVIGGFRLTGGSGAIEGVTIAYTTNPAILPFGTSTTFTLQQTHLGSQTTLGTATIPLVSSGMNPTVLTLVLRIEVVGSAVAVKVNGVTIITGTTTVSQLGKGYFYIQNDIHWIPAGEYEGTLAGFFGCNNLLQYAEYGEFGSSVITKTNNVALTGGGSAPASAMDVTVIDPALTPTLLFNLDQQGSGDGQHMQQVDRTAFSVGPRLTVPTFTGVSGGGLNQFNAFSLIGASPGQFWKVDGATFTSSGTHVLTGNGSPTDPYPQFDLTGNAYITTYSGSDTVVNKVRCSDLAVLATLTIPSFSYSGLTRWDARAIDNGRGYLYVAGQQGGVCKMAKVALGSFSVSTMIPLAPMTKANCAAVLDDHLYIGGGTGDIDGSPSSAQWYAWQYNLNTSVFDNSFTYINFNEVVSLAIDPATSKIYFGNRDVLAGGHGRILIATIPNFTASSVYDLGVNASPIRALALDSTYLYATLPPAAHGGATWWLFRINKGTLSGLGYITDATWTGTAPVQGAKTIMVL